jgi:hypothetical protein
MAIILINLLILLYDVLVLMDILRFEFITGIILTSISIITLYDSNL